MRGSAPGKSTGSDLFILSGSGFRVSEGCAWTRGLGGSRRRRRRSKMRVAGRHHIRTSRVTRETDVSLTPLHVIPDGPDIHGNTTTRGATARQRGKVE
ncbi:unnamed protein product [[Candida] boidinii]|nr:unnamed protein product [[Candida] boidinii]